MVDGVSAIELGLALLDVEPDGRPLDLGSSDAPPTSQAGAVELLRGAAWGSARALLTAGQDIVREPFAVRRRMEDALSTATRVRTLAGFALPVPGGPLNQSHTTARKIALTTLPLATAKAIKDEVGGTINDVVLATVGEAVHRYLEHRGTRTDGLRHRVLIPVNTRAAGDDGAAGNRLSGMLVELPVGPMAPSRRLWAVSKLKSGGQAGATSRFVDWAALAPPPVQALASRVGLGNQWFVNLIVSNLAGVQMPLYLGGSRLLEVYPLLPLGANMGLVVCVLSYDKTLHVGLVGDAVALDDIDVLQRALRGGFRDLARESAVAPPAKRTAANRVAANRNRTTSVNAAARDALRALTLEL
jgi:WS/DGAT/MGAT family acyltransferase